ncbi:MAG: fibronectin type III domain-containing protein, partial [Actinomyces sp.]
TISASLSGTVLTVSAPEITPTGSAGSIAVSVTDEQGNTVNGSIPVEVVGTTKPRIQVPAYNVKAKVGETVSVDVASQATNPFPDTPISLEGAAIALGDATTSTSGTVVTITPNSAGTISIAYRVNDKLKDPSRVVQGTITVVVTGRPDTPTGVVARAKGPTGATVSFNAPASNGERITEYRIYSGGRQVASCTETVCEVNGLTTGSSYTFTVTAVNASGESEGATSNSVTLSGVPDRPGGPTVTAGDGELAVRWDAPNSNGSRITSYTVYATIAGAAASSCTTNGEQECTIKNLVNGRTYTVTVVATNANGNSQASPGTTGTPKATIQAPDKPVISKAEPKQVGTSMVLDLSWILGKSGSSGWGTTTVRVGDQSPTVAGGSTYRQVSVTPGTTVNVSVTVTNLQGESATSDTRTVTIPALTPVREPKGNVPKPDAPVLRTPPNNDVGKIQVSNARLREGNGYKASDLELFYADSAAGCTAPGNPVAFNNGDRADFNIGPLTPGATVTFYFCQRGKKDDGSYAWSDTVAVTGVVGNGQRSRDDDDDPIPTFEVQATASYVQKNRSWGVAASWTNPSGAEITQTNIWIEGMKDATKQSWSGPLTNWWAEDLAPGREYTIVVQVIGNNGQHREVRTTVRTGDVADNVKVTFEGAVTCPNGQPCGSMTLRAVNAPNYQSGVTLVCSVKTGRPSSVTQFRFSRDNPQITGILTEATTAAELLAKPPVIDCHAE